MGVRLGVVAIWLVGIGAVLAPDAARAADTWTDSFPAAATASYLRSSDKTLFVAAAGAATADRTQATEALVAALRGAPAPRTVFTAESLGAVDDLDDVAICKKASHLPVDLLAIVRVFPGGGGSSTAVVTFLSKACEPLTAMSAARGTAIAAAAGNEARSPGRGVSAEAAQAVETTHQEHTAAKERRAEAPAEAQYRNRQIGFQDWIGVNQYGAVVASWSQPFQGSPANPLSVTEFFDAVDRPDLAASSRRRSTVKWSLVAAGAATATVGAVYVLLGGDSAGKCDTAYTTTSSGYSTCLDQATASDTKRLTTGLVISGIGTAVLVAALFIPTNPASPQEAYDMAQRHNRKLRESLGLPGDATQRGAPGARWFARLDAPGANLGGVSVGAAF